MGKLRWERQRRWFGAAERWDKKWYKAHDACLLKGEPNLNQYRYYSEIPYALFSAFGCWGHMHDNHPNHSLTPIIHAHAIGRRWGSGVMSSESEKWMGLRGVGITSIFKLYLMHQTISTTYVNGGGYTTSRVPYCFWFVLRFSLLQDDTRFADNHGINLLCTF